MKYFTDTAAHDNTVSSGVCKSNAGLEIEFTGGVHLARISIYARKCNSAEEIEGLSGCQCMSRNHGVHRVRIRGVEPIIYAIVALYIIWLQVISQSQVER